MSPVTSEGVVAETRAFNAELERRLAGVPAANALPVEVTRRARAEGRGIFPASRVLPQGQARTAPGRAGAVPVRLFVPEHVAGAYLHIHGGGWTFGGHDEQDEALWRMCEGAGVAVVSVGYRLAPENPYPAAADDCEDVASWLVESSQGEFGTDRVVIGGESAGAHLAAVVLLRLRDLHGMGNAFRGANLVYGAYDLSMTPSQRRWGDRNLILSTPVITWFLDNFLPGSGAEARRDPDISPLYADLTGLPAALFTVGTLDPLLDDTLFMEARWRAAGNPTALDVYEEAVHGFTAFPIGAARASQRAQVAFVRDAVR
jgi:acetyl esterase